MSRGVVRLVVLALALSSWQCAPPPAVRLGWHPHASPDQLLAMSDSTVAALRDLTAEVRIALRHSEAKVSASAALLYRSPDLFRIDVHGPLFTHILTALVHGDSLTVLSQGQSWQSADAGRLLARITDVYLGDYNVSYALMGLVEPGRIDPTVRIDYPRADRAIVTLMDEDDVRRRLWLDLSSGFVTGEEVAPGGAVLWRRDLADSRLRDAGSGGGVYLPSKVRITQRDLTIDITYRSCVVNGDLEPRVLLSGIPGR